MSPPCLDLLDLVLTYDCNLKCTYCTITDAMRRVAAVPVRLALAEIAAAGANGCTALSLTGGEPTLRRELLGLVRHARACGFTDIKVQTNGLLFSEAANLQRAIDTGVTRVGVSVHTYRADDPNAYDACVRFDGAQPLMLAALDHLIASPVALSVDLIMMRSTLGTLFDTLVSLAERGVRSFNLWLVSLTDNNAANVDSLPRLSEVTGLIARCCAFGRERGVDVRSLHVPRCLLPGDEAHVAHPGAGQAVRVVSPDAVFELSASRLSGGVKPPRCETCVYTDRCPGLREDYVARFGSDEVQPVRSGTSNPPR